MTNRHLLFQPSLLPFFQLPSSHLPIFLSINTITTANRYSFFQPSLLPFFQLPASHLQYKHHYYSKSSLILSTFITSSSHLPTFPPYQTKPHIPTDVSSLQKLSNAFHKKHYICENHKTMHQEALLKEIRRKIGERSLNDEIANILNISYDAAHRRTSLKAKFSFEEALELAKYYQISLDQFLGTENQLVVKRTQPVKTTEDLLNYFENSLKILNVFQDITHSKVFYSAKDIPFFYTISDSILSRFKFYVWMNLLNQDKFLSPFHDFKMEYHSVKNEMLKDLYDKQNVTEIWNDTTIMSALRQISFYYEMGLVRKNDVDLILDDLKKLLEELENKTLEKTNFQIYVNDLVILNNSILFKNDQQCSFFVPFSMFGYMMTNDKLTCEDSLSYFEHQIKNSRSLNESGNRERKVFFNKMYEQIERLKQNLS